MIINWNGITNPKTKKLVPIDYDQVKNSVEAMIRKIKLEYKNAILGALRGKLDTATYMLVEKIIDETLAGFLESCGPAALCVIMEGLDYLGYFNYPTLNGKMIQMDDFVTNFLNDPKNDKLFSSGNYMDNRVMANYVTLAHELFGCRAVIIKKPSFEFVQTVIDDGNGVLLCKINPGHYIACGDTKDDTILYKDSWIKSNTVLTRDEFNNNIIPYAVVFYKKPVEKKKKRWFGR